MTHFFYSQPITETEISITEAEIYITEAEIYISAVVFSISETEFSISETELFMSEALTNSQAKGRREGGNLSFYAPKSRVMRGMVMMENRVVMNVASVMSEGFLPYFIQNIVPKDATGIAITTVLMLLMSVLTPHRRNRKYTERGTITSRRKEVA